MISQVVAGDGVEHAGAEEDGADQDVSKVKHRSLQIRWRAAAVKPLHAATTLVLAAIAMASVEGAVRQQHFVRGGLE